jgi:hypothetical protein
MTTETTAKTLAEPNPWHAPSYAWVLLATLGLQVGLYLSQHFGGLDKGQAVLIAVAATAGLPLWVVACRVFRLKSQFGLRTLLLAVVVVAIPSGWLSRELERARNQRALVERFRIYNYLDGGPRLVPNWLRKSFGDDFFAELEGVGFDAPESGAGLAQLRGFTTLRSLYLRETQVKDDALANLRELTNLSELSLNGTPVTDAGLAHIHKLTNLETLCLLGTQVTDDGLIHLRGLKNLQFLYLSGTPVTDDKVRQLQADLPECQMDR